MFASKVARTGANTSSGAARTKLDVGNSRGNASRPATVAMKNTELSNRIGQDVDIFDDDDDVDPPGPGAYYNPQSQTCFKTGKRPERL